MKVRLALAGLAVGTFLAVAACQTTSAGTEAAAAAPASDQPVDVRSAMIQSINPAALTIWDVGNNAVDDYGGLDPAMMDEPAWDRLQDAAESLGDEAHRLAGAKTIHASGPDLVGGKVPEGVASKEQIQAMIDANPDGFRASAAELERYAYAIGAAAKARDIKTAGELVFTFDSTCQSCHENYWYLKP